MLPKWTLDAAKASQEPAKSLPRHSKMTSKRLQDARRHSQTHRKHAPDTPKMCQDCPGRHKTSQRLPQGPPRPLQSSIFDGLGNLKLQFFDYFPEHPALQASKHPRWGRRNVRSVWLKTGVLTKFIGTVQGVRKSLLETLPNSSNRIDRLSAEYQSLLYQSFPL